MKENNAIKQQINEIETGDYKTIIRSNGDLLIYVSSGRVEINAVVQNPNLKEYQVPIEPDGQYLTSWFMFASFKPGLLIDNSGFQNHATIIGSPATQTGPVQDMPAWQFQIEDQLVIPNNPDNSNNSQDAVEGFGVQFRIFWIAVNLHNNVPRIIACKTDDSGTAKQYGWSIWLEPNGTLYFHVRVAGVKYTTSKTNAFTSLNKWYNVSCQFDKPTHTPKIYINAIFSGEGVSNYVHPNIILPSNLNMYISGYDVANAGRLEVLMADFRYWKNKILTLAELEDLEINGYSISDIKHVARIGTWSLPANEAYDLGPDNPPPIGSPPPTPEAPPDPTPGQSDYFNSTHFATDYFV